jgi:superfamily II DNA/RNA helicase
VIANFDPNTREPRDDWRILVTTDVLAEGVNLHRSATVINYDIPWNPSRMIAHLCL